MLDFGEPTARPMWLGVTWQNRMHCEASRVTVRKVLSTVRKALQQVQPRLGPNDSSTACRTIWLTSILAVPTRAYLNRLASTQYDHVSIDTSDVLLPPTPHRRRSKSYHVIRSFPLNTVEHCYTTF